MQVATTPKSQRLDDDLERDLTVEDYRAAMDDAVEAFASDEVSVYRFGALDPPRSDIDLVLCVPDPFPRDRIESLEKIAIEFLASKKPLRNYFYTHSIFVCSSELAGSFYAEYHACQTTISNFVHLGGSEIAHSTLPDGRAWRFVRLLDRLFNQATVLGDLMAERVISLRKTLSILHKIRDHIVVQALGIYADPELVELKASLDQMEEEILANPSFDRAAFFDVIARTQRRLSCYSSKVCRQYFSDVFKDVDGNPVPHEDIIAQHFASYGRFATRNSDFVHRLRADWPHGSSIVTDEGYREAIRWQIDVINEVASWYRRFWFKGLELQPVPVRIGHYYNLAPMPPTREFQNLCRDRFPKAYHGAKRAYYFLRGRGVPEPPRFAHQSYLSPGGPA